MDGVSMGIRSLSVLICIVILLMVVALGNAAGAITGMDTDLGDSDASFVGEGEDDLSGDSLAFVGDVNGDGYDDFLIGAYHNDEGGTHAGQAYLFFGKVNGWSIDTNVSNADASFLGENAEDWAGISVAGAGDVNGDGYDDILIGAWLNDEGGVTAGQTYLIFGRSTGWSRDTDLSKANASFWGENTYDYSGNSVVGAGDVNGDGYDDILIGAYGDDDGGSHAGQTYLILGKKRGWSMDTDLSNADASFWGENVGDKSGQSVAGAGDVNGDGYDDFLIGSRNNGEGGPNAGQAYLILGHASGWSMDMDLADVDASFIGEDPGDRSGWWIAGAGDVNGDGYDDILIGAYGDGENEIESGQTYLIFGRSSGWSMDTNLSTADASFLGENMTDYSGFCVAGAGDVNNDGYDDILIGAFWNDERGADAGQTYLILGRRSGWTMDTDLAGADASFSGENAGDGSGHCIAGAGDVNGDGYDDILIGAFYNDQGGDKAGKTYLIFSNNPPVFGPVPVLKAVEDVPITYDFSGYVSDPDTPLRDLSLTSPSPYVTSVDGLNVTFEFPNGILTATVPLNLSDGLFQAAGAVDFTIQPVNDPPFVNIWNNKNVYEDVPLTFDLSSMIWDIDNDHEDLFILLDSPYVTVEGLVLSVLFTEPVGEYDLYLNVSDGIDTIPDMIHFYVKTKTGTPGAPRNLTAAAGDGFVDLEWLPPVPDIGNAVVGYYIYWNLDPRRRSLLVNVDANTLTYRDANVTNGVIHYYLIGAYNVHDSISFSHRVSAMPVGPPGAPAGLTVEASAYILDLSWDGPLDDGGSDVLNFNVYRGTSPSSLEYLMETSGSSTGFLDRRLTAGTTYYYGITAVTAIGESEMSDVVQGTPYGFPSAPRNLVATAGDGEVFLTWEPPENDGGYPITGYIFSPWLADGISPPLTNINIGLVTSYIDEYVVNDVTYHFTVTAVTEGGKGDPSAIAEATPFRPATEPGQVTLAEPDVTKRSVTLSWTAPMDDGGSPVTGYIIYRGGVVEMEPYADVGATTTTFTDEDVERGESYWYVVVAVNDVGEGELHYPEKVMIPIEVKEGSPTLGGVFVLLAMLVGVAFIMMRRKS